MGTRKRRGWTLQIIPDDESNPRQIRVPRTVVYTVVGVVGLLVLYAIVWTILFWVVARRAAQVEPLRQRVQELENSTGQLDKLGAELNRLKAFEKQIRGVLTNRESGSSSDFFGSENFRLDDEVARAASAARPASSPVGEARSLGGMGYTALDVPTVPPVRGYITRTYYEPHHADPASHYGLDLAAREGTPVVAAADGLVLFAGWSYPYGNLIVLDHRSGYTTVYGHNQVLFVRAGDRVRQGQPIALLGNSGVSSAPHLHFELWSDGTPVDPRAVLRLAP